jgi:hypothetical protein
LHSVMTMMVEMRFPAAPPRRSGAKRTKSLLGRADAHPPIPLAAKFSRRYPRQAARNLANKMLPDRATGCARELQ